MIHLVERFVGCLGWTVCGIYSENVTAYREMATCGRCKRRNNPNDQYEPRPNKGTSGICEVN